MGFFRPSQAPAWTPDASLWSQATVVGCQIITDIRRIRRIRLLVPVEFLRVLLGKRAESWLPGAAAH